MARIDDAGGLDLGVDAGGTKAAWVAIDAAGVVRATGVGPGIQAVTDGVAVAGRRLAALVREVEAAHGPVASLCAGLAGAGRSAVRDGIAAAVASDPSGAFAGPVAIVGDPQVAAAAVLADGPGVAVWAGTGSFAVARGDAGELVRTGGRGWLVDDRGGAFALVVAAARAVVEAADGVGPGSGFGPALVAALDVEGPEHVGAALQVRPPREVAALLPTLLAVVDAGEPRALAAFRAEFDALARRAAAAAARAGLELAAIGPVLGGGVLSGAASCRALLDTALQDLGFAASRVAGASAAHGAARLARAVRRGEAPLAGWVPR